LSILTDPIGTTKKRVDLSLICQVCRFEIGRLPGASWLRRLLQLLRPRAGSLGDTNDEHDAPFVPLFRLARLAARHPVYSPEILKKRAACGKA
jgi:hypothetical protein